MDWTKRKKNARQCCRKAFLVFHSLGSCCLCLMPFNQRWDCYLRDTIIPKEKENHNSTLVIIPNVFFFFTLVDDWILSQLITIMFKAIRPSCKENWMSEVVNYKTNVCDTLTGTFEIERTNWIPQIDKKKTFSTNHWPASIMSITYWFITIVSHTCKIMIFKNINFDLNYLWRIVRIRYQFSSVYDVSFEESVEEGDQTDDKSDWIEHNPQDLNLWRRQLCNYQVTKRNTLR